MRHHGIHACKDIRNRLVLTVHVLLTDIMQIMIVPYPYLHEQVHFSSYIPNVNGWEVNKITGTVNDLPVHC